MSTYTRTLESKLCEITQGFKAGVHDGIDLVNKGYTLGYISAHSGGIVVATRNNCNGFENGSYGNYVKIKHDNGMYTMYAHMAYNTVCVSVGQRVNEGDRLGYMGNTGYSFGGHLHFEVRNSNDGKIDPTPYLNAPLPSSVGKDVNVYYRVKTQKHGWLPEVKNLEDYAGFENSPIVGLAIKVDKGLIKYRVHEVGGGWLGWINDYDINNGITGWAGNNKPIDLVEVYYYTPSDVRPYKKAKYKVNNYPYQYDNETTNGQDGYAGEIGVAVTKFQISIE